MQAKAWLGKHWQGHTITRSSWWLGSGWLQCKPKHGLGSIGKATQSPDPHGGLDPGGCNASQSMAWEALARPHNHQILMVAWIRVAAMQAKAWLGKHWQGHTITRSSWWLGSGW